MSPYRVKTIFYVKNKTSCMLVSQYLSKNKRICHYQLKKTFVC